MFQIANLLLGLYILWRCIWPMRLSKSAKLIMGGLTIALIEHHWLVSVIFKTSMPSPEMPRGVLIILGVVYTALLLTALTCMIKDLVGLVVRVIAGRSGAAILKSQVITAGLFALSTVAAAWGAWEAVRVPRITHITAELPGLSAELSGYRMVLLTDLHASRLLPEPWIVSVVAETNAQSPDLIVISGDLVDGTTLNREADVAPLDMLEAQDGVFAVSGNHEYYAEYEAWMARFRELGITVLQNEHVVIQSGLGGFVLAGVPDEVAKKHGEPGPDINQALHGRPSGLPTILLDHRPGHMRANQAAGVDLQLSGHTHGGHIQGVDLVVRQFNGGFVSGMYDVGPAKLYVSNGAGLWPGLPTRIGVPSEITVITLRPKANAP